MCTCNAGEICNFDCPAGGCDIVCINGSSCQSDCSGGGCNIDCDVGSQCDFTCSGGGCTFDCDVGSVCDIDCAGGGCVLDSCDSGSTCNVDCPGGGCEAICEVDRRATSTAQAPPATARRRATPPPPATWPAISTVRPSAPSRRPARRAAIWPQAVTARAATDAPPDISFALSERSLRTLARRSFPPYNDGRAVLERMTPCTYRDGHVSLP